MRRLATTDAMTGLANRRQFFALAENELMRARRYGGAVGIVMADLDRFKAVNDRCGHGAGDALIAAVGEELRLQQRPHDVIARMGGEEFALVLPGAELEACVAAAERVREAIEGVSIEYQGERVRATMSLGCAAVADARAAAEEAPGELLARMLRDADAALYELNAWAGTACTPPHPAGSVIPQGARYEARPGCRRLAPDGSRRAAALRPPRHRRGPHGVPPDFLHRPPHHRFRSPRGQRREGQDLRHRDPAGRDPRRVLGIPRAHHEGVLGPREGPRAAALRGEPLRGLPARGDRGPRVPEVHQGLSLQSDERGGRAHRRQP